MRVSLGTSGHVSRPSQLTLDPNSSCFPALASWRAATGSAFLTQLHEQMNERQTGQSQQ